MITEIHIAADSECWRGASTRALHAAKAADDAVVVTAGDADMAVRFEREGLRTLRCSMRGWFAALSLSRVLRNVPGSQFAIYVHSPEVVATVERALKLVGRREPMTLHPDAPRVEFPRVEVEHPAPGAEPLLMWLGNITAHCGLAEVIEDLGRAKDKPWRLRVVGQGRGRVVSPILRRCKALGIAHRIEWAGYSPNPYDRMHGVTAGIAREGSTAAREFAAASIPVYTSLKFCEFI